MNRDKKIGLGFIIFSLIVWFFIIPTQVARESFYPKITTLWIFVWSLILVAQSWKGTPKKVPYGLQEQRTIVQVLFIAILFLIYILIIDFFGFFLPSFLFLVLTMLALGVRDWKILLLLPIMVFLFLYVILEKVLVFPLPKGRIF